MEVTLTIDLDVENADQVKRLVDRLFNVTETETAPAKDDAAAEKKAKAAAAKKAKAEKEEEEKPASVATRDDVRAKLKEYAALEGKDKAIQILKDHGAASIGELDEGKFDDVVAACGD